MPSRKPRTCLIASNVIASPLVISCSERRLAEARELVEKSEMREWRTRHSRNQLIEREKKGPVGPEKEKEEDKLERFFCHLYEFHNPVPKARVFVPAKLPPQYAISFVPAVSAVSALPVNSATPRVTPVIAVNSAPRVTPVIAVGSATSVSSPYSIVSSANFVLPSSSVLPPSSSATTHCMPTT